MASYITQRITTRDGHRFTVMAGPEASVPPGTQGPWTHLDVGMPSHDSGVSGVRLREFGTPSYAVDGSPIWFKVPIETILLAIESHGGLCPGHPNLFFQ